MIVSMNVVLNSRCEQQYIQDFAHCSRTSILHLLTIKPVLIMLLKSFHQLRALSNEGGGGEGVIIKITVGLGIYTSKMKLRKR